MSETQGQKIRAVCPHCQKHYALPMEFVGKNVKCKQCQQGFVVAVYQGDHPVTSAPGPAAASGSARAAASSVLAAPSVSSASTASAAATGVLCPVCQSPVDSAESTRSCPQCHSPHHQECWDYNRGCGLYGCKEAPETEKLQDIEIPASFWGQTEKKCPNCQQGIQAAALRCRHCGTEFKTTRPRDGGEFRAEKSLQSSLPIHRNIGIVLLIAAIVPCTAPFAAVVGCIWNHPDGPAAGVRALNAAIAEAYADGSS